MNEKDYLQWFAENLQTAQSFFDGTVLFTLTLDNARWQAGYSYFEDYEGDYFFDSLEGRGETALEALDKSYDKTLPIVQRLYDIRLQFDNPKKFIKGEKYTLIMLGRSGEIQIMSVVATGPESHGRGEIFHSELGHVLLYGPERHKLIFPFIPAETLKEL